MIVLRCIGILLLSLLLADTGFAQALKQKRVTFEAKGKKIVATLRIPHATHPLPAIVIVHGTAGIDARGEFYKVPLEAAGFATLEVDFKSGIFTGPKDRPRNPTFIPYLFAAVAALHEQADIDRSRIGVLGFSLGGQLVLNSAMRNLSAPYASKGLKIAAGASLYPACQLLVERAKAFNGMPILILVGSNDHYTTPENCYSAKRIANARYPGSVDVVVYKGAFHAFDRPGRMHTIEDPNARRGKAVVAYDKAAAEDARKRIVEFFKARLAPAGG